MIKEIFLVFIIIAFLLAIPIFYFSSGDPLFFFDALGWIIEPKNDNMVYLENISWLKIENAEKLQKLYPEILDVSGKKAYFFIVQYIANPNEVFVKPEESLTSPKKYKSTYTLVCKNGPILSWSSMNPTDNKKLATFGTMHGLEQPWVNLIYFCSPQQWKDVFRGQSKLIKAE